MKSSFIKIFTAFIAVLCFNAGFAQLQKEQVLDKIVAKVDNEIVLQSELDVAYLQFSRQNNSFMTSREELKCKVLETLIINKLLVAKAEIDSVEIEPSMVDDQMDRRMKMLLASYGGDEETLAQQYGKTVDELKSELRAQVEEQMLVQRMQGKITTNVEVTPVEVKKFFKSIPADSLPYFSKELEIGHIVYKPEFDKEAKKAAYDKLMGLKQRIQNGEKFEDLARAFSQDPGSAANGGELGFFKRKELVPEYEATALNLRPGEISDPVESQFGFHLIQLIEKRGNEYNTRHILIKPEYSGDRLASSKKFLEKLRQQILSDSISFEDAVFKYSSDDRTKASGGFFLSDKGSTMIPADQLDYTLYFIAEGLQEGEISAPQVYAQEDGSQAVRIVYVRRKVDPHAANLNDDYQKIHDAALEEKKNDVVNHWFENTKHEIFIDVDAEYSSCQILAQ